MVTSHCEMTSTLHMPMAHAMSEQILNNAGLNWSNCQKAPVQTDLDDTPQA